MKTDGLESQASIPVPVEFFTDVLPEIRDLGELKVVMHVFQLASRPSLRAVPVGDLYAPDVVRSVATEQSPIPSVERVRAALERAVANGAVLRLSMSSPHGPLIFLLPATEEHRRIVAGLASDPEALEALDLPVDLEASIYRPNVFALYERHVGPLTPLVADQLRDAERAYPRAWIEAAILEADVHNRRNWRYIDAILKQWEEGDTPESRALRGH